MTIHTVKAGETLFSVAALYGVPFRLAAIWNGLTEPYGLAPGQSLLILNPTELYTVRSGDTPEGIASRTGLSVRTLYAYNPNLYGGRQELYPGETLVLGYSDRGGYEMSVNAYAYPFISPGILSQTLPYLSYLTPFTYGITSSGGLLPLNDGALVSSAYSYGARPQMHLSTLTENGNFSTALAIGVLSDSAKSERLIDETVATMLEKGYTALDIDFEYLEADYALPYAEFAASAREALSPYGYPVTVALAPKTYASQPGLLYEGHNYAALGEAADFVLLMTYEWGYTYGPPMAVAPITSVESVLTYAITEILPAKIYLGIPNYAYDWLLPYRKDFSRAMSISNERAVAIAVEKGAVIHFDEAAQTPYFNYIENGSEHEVWFEDPRSILSKLALISRYGLYGAGYWNAMRPFNANWLITATGYTVRSF